MSAAAKTAEPPLYANRVKVYTKDVHGPVRRAKWAIMVFCLAVYYALPWLRWDRGPGVPNQALLLDINTERFYFFDIVLWPQDVYLLAGALILGAFVLFLVTSLFGRVWCGYTCPQTVWTDLFMTVERWLEGDRNTRMKRDNAAWTAATWRLKITKHAIWLAIAFWTGGAWIMYFADAPSTTVQFWTLSAPLPVYALTFLFTGTTYLLGGIAREQVCTYMCPWPRFQSAMLDQQSMIVTYESWRGEPRAAGRRVDDPAGGGKMLGDCVDCDACVHVCPTGVDIRDGVQLGCINCGLCIDACNHVMAKLGSPANLVTWDTLARQQARAAGRQEKLHFLRARTIMYLAAVAVVAVLLMLGVAMRSTATLSVIHDRAPLFVRLQDGTLRNGFTVKIANKTMQPASYTLHLQGLDQARLTLAGGAGSAADNGRSVNVQVPASEVGEFRVLIHAPETMVAGGRAPFQFMLDQASGKHLTYSQLFMGPGGDEE